MSSAEDQEIVRAHATAALAIFRVATETLRLLVHKGILTGEEAGAIVRAARSTLPPEEANGISGALMHDTFLNAAAMVEQGQPR